MSKLEPGTYKAKIKNYGIVSNEKGEQVVVEFGLENGMNYRWYGKINGDKGGEITIKNLFTMGANQSNFTKVADGLKSNVLNTSKEFEVVVASRKYNGKEYTEIKYINDPSAPRANAPQFVQGSNSLQSMKGIAAQIAAEQGLKTANSEDVPF